jgi:hypothetical protein
VAIRHIPEQSELHVYIVVHLAKKIPAFNSNVSFPLSLLFGALQRKETMLHAAHLLQAAGYKFSKYIH